MILKTEILTICLETQLQMGEEWKTAIVKMHRGKTHALNKH